MGVGHEVARWRGIRDYLAGTPPEALLLAGRLDVRTADERLNVSDCVRDRKRAPKDGRMGGDAQVGHDRGPEQVDDLWSLRGPSDQVQADGMVRLVSSDA